MNNLSARFTGTGRQSPSAPLDLTGNVTKLDNYYSKAGGFSDVYEAQYNRADGAEKVAVKVFRFKFSVAGHCDERKGSKMIRRELGIWRRLRHPNIVQFLGIVYNFEGRESPSLVSQWMSNGTLESFFSQYDDRLMLAHRLQLLLDIANGVSYLHSFPVVHGDLTCTNVLLDQNFNACLTDFGLASMIGDIPDALGYLQMTTTRPGALRWAAPEHFPDPDTNVVAERTTKSDIYSFGNLAFLMLSGKHPWSEVTQDIAVVLRLHRGGKPSRPESRPIEDTHWELIERCWLPMNERPLAKEIVSILKLFCSSCPPTKPLRTTLYPDLAFHAPRGSGRRGQVRVPGPLRGTPIPAGHKFGAKDASTGGGLARLWSLWRPTDRVSTSTGPVFGVPLEESLRVAEIARLPAVIFRCMQYLEAKKADQEEGIYRVSGSSGVIVGLKNRFNTEGDVDLLASDEYWDPYAIAGLLKTFFRDLPASTLQRELHIGLLSVTDIVRLEEPIRELSHLLASLPIANYHLLRALAAHLIWIVQNSPVNKMTMPNICIVFSPTLGIPSSVLRLMLEEFNLVFNVDAASNIAESDTDKEGKLSRRNGRQYSDAAADRLRGFAGGASYTPPEETPSEDSDGVSLQYETGNETTGSDPTMESILDHIDHL